MWHPWKTAAGLLSFSAVVAFAGPMAWSQEDGKEREIAIEARIQASPAPQQVIIQATPVVRALPGGDGAQEMHAASVPRKYWIGLMCTPADDVLRSHLGLEAGLVVQEAVTDSPSAKAGLLPHDVLLKAGDKVLTSIDDLVQAVEGSEGKELTLELLRKGQKTTVKVTPVKPPADVWRAGVGVPPDVMKWFQAVPTQPGQFWIPQPGIVAPPHLALGGHKAKLPADLSITITRKGEEPAKIKVSKGDQKWEVTEDKVKELPDDVRPFVEQMLGGQLAIAATPKGRVEARFDRLEDVRKRFPQAAEALRIYERLAPTTGAGKLEKEMADIKAQLEELKKAVESLKKDK